MNPVNRIAVALGLKTTAATLEALERLRGRIGFAEIRLDLMEEFDLDMLIGRSPCPLVVTCRPPREGGSFRGLESERLEILGDASALGCAFVDVEWDCAAHFRCRGDSTKVIVSRHFHDSMPQDLWDEYAALRPLADVVKLVGSARDLADTLPVLELMVNARSPVIAIAMGAAGLITRLIAPCFDSCLLTYAAASAERGTAPGQISVDSMIEHYGADRAGPDTPVKVCLYSDPLEENAVVAACKWNGERLGIPALVDKDKSRFLQTALEALTPRIEVSVL